MVKHVAYSLFLLFLSVFQMDGAAEHLECKVNGYGDPIIIVRPGCDQQELLDEIVSKKRSFFVDLSLLDEEIIKWVPLLRKDHGFSVFDSDDDRIRLFKKIGDVNIARPFTCQSSAKVFVSRKINGVLEVLFTREGRKFATLPGGMINRGERIFNTALREMKEELGLSIRPEDLKFLGVLHRIGLEYDATHHQYAFHTHFYGDQDIVVDGQEVKGIVWVPVKKILKTGKVIDVPITGHQRLVLKALNQGKQGVPCEHMPDYRQITAKERYKDPSDIMDFYFVYASEPKLKVSKNRRKELEYESEELE